ncbi:MAG: hypothetical protein K9M98_09215 [Cephaloticoccus sp.]|nr:hypothetical protein [Cephaloticoccus sp.]
MAGTVYTYFPVTGIPVTVPVVFDGSVGNNGQPITGMTATINNLPVNGILTGEGTLNASFVGSADLTDPGTYVVKVNATNLNGTSEAQTDISVVVNAPPPTITVATPTAGATFNYVNNTPGASVSVSYTAVSAYGNITSTGVSLDGLPLALNLSGVGTATTATGSTSLVLTQGDYVLEFNAANAFGVATPVAVPIKVRSMEPSPVIPTVSIPSPAGGAVFERTEGDPATVVNYSFTGNTTSGVINSVTVTLDGGTVSPSVSGLNTADITGTGSASYSAAGTHTLSVTVSNGQGTATALTSFTVNETPLQVCQNLTWLPPISLNKTVEGGSTVPIKFRLDCHGNFVEDHSTIITIYEIYPDGSFSAPVVYPYGTGSPNPPDYAITGQMYHLNFATAKGTHRYRIEVYHPLNAEGTSLQLLGAKELLTQGKGKSCKSEKTSKSSKSKKDDKSIKSSKGGKDQKSAKNSKSKKSTKSSRR